MTTCLFVGLGNPGSTYASTRHNIGYTIIDWLTAQLAGTKWKLHRRQQILETEYQTTNRLFLFAKPTTFMNNAGSSVAKLVQHKKISPHRLWIVHDDLDLAVGTVRVSFNSRSAGHRGVQSVIDALGTQQFHRIRVGIGNGREHGIPAETYVLQRFTTNEQKTILRTTSEFLLHFLPQRFPELSAPLANAYASFIKKKPPQHYLQAQASPRKLG